MSILKTYNVSDHYLFVIVWSIRLSSFWSSHCPGDARWINNGDGAEATGRRDRWIANDVALCVAAAIAMVLRMRRRFDASDWAY